MLIFFLRKLCINHFNQILDIRKMLELLFVHYLALYRVSIYYLLSLYVLLIFML